MAGYAYKGKERDVVREPTHIHGKRTPAPCGTPAAYRRHQRQGEQPCDDCRAAWNAYIAERRGSQLTGRRNRPAVACGTHSGYKTHRRKGEKPCGDCTAAYNAYRRQWRANRKQEAA